jgi:DNA (cytosine-5)-methyltransferase 1
MSEAAISAWTRQIEPNAEIRLIDPFGGDGRLAIEFIRKWIGSNYPSVRWRVTLWDLNEEGLAEADSKLRVFQEETGLDILWELVAGDSFHLAIATDQTFDVVISNPPWELLKPDRRDLKPLSCELAESYVDAMREYDSFLSKAYPTSQPTRKFAGWGTNLSRVGFDVCRAILAQNGIMAIVMPASFMADDLSLALRKEVLERFTVHEIAYFPAEAKLYGSADVSTITIVLEPRRINGVAPVLTRFDKDLKVSSRRAMKISRSFLKEAGFVIPVSVGGDALAVLRRLTANFPAWSELEGPGVTSLWAGREVDETGSRSWLSADADGPLFIKGRMIDRFALRESPSERIGKPGWSPPPSVEFVRIAWRDVSRPNQKRRVIATLIPPGIAAGNSLGVAYFQDDDQVALRALLGVMSSLVFEFQLRSHLATGHVSLSSLRKVRVPPRTQLDLLTAVANEVDLLLANPMRSQARLEALVAHQAYGLTEQELRTVMDTFGKLSSEEREAILCEYKKLSASEKAEKHDFYLNRDKTSIEIPNHFSARLSKLDMQMVEAVPEGGNWKDIPESIPSKRLKQIRESFKRGEGSRSTYYGRLRADMPSYTINTYFNRPGNGCHIHPFQNRVLSQREAARLQSFPDWFRFVGPQGIVNKQIGNAVPPLLAYQIAIQLGTPGVFVDLFSGAGGLGLGFTWAGWQPLVANDIEPRFLETYRLNVHDSVVLGSITDPAVREEIVSRARELRMLHPHKPFWILGGPPCQGFSTAGHKRSMEDERNHLFWDYCKVLEELRPDGFVFENVTGLLNMQKGKVFEMVKEAFKSIMPRVDGWLLSAEEFAVPQRRKRVFLIGTADPDREVTPPESLTSCTTNGELFSANEDAISVSEAIADLPALEPGQDGSHLPYASPPQTTYQAFMRGLIGPAEFLESVRKRERIWRGR